MKRYIEFFVDCKHSRCSLGSPHTLTSERAMFFHADHVLTAVNGELVALITTGRTAGGSAKY